MEAIGRLTIKTGNADLTQGFNVVGIDINPRHYVALSVTDTGVGTTFKIYLPAMESGK